MLQIKVYLPRALTLMVIYTFLILRAVWEVCQNCTSVLLFRVWFSSLLVGHCWQGKGGKGGGEIPFMGQCSEHITLCRQLSGQELKCFHYSRAGTHSIGSETLDILPTRSAHPKFWFFKSNSYITILECLPWCHQKVLSHGRSREVYFADLINLSVLKWRDYTVTSVPIQWSVLTSLMLFTSRKRSTVEQNVLCLKIVLVLSAVHKHETVNVWTWFLTIFFSKCTCYIIFLYSKGQQYEHCWSLFSFLFL